MHSRVRRALGVFTAIAVGLCALEVTLQIAAAAVAIGYRRPTATVPADSGHQIVLCMGDSYTFGFGATSAAASYPSVLARRLEAEANPSWRVVNAGWPGRNSRDVLLALRGEQLKVRPRYVVVLVGANDLWSHPALVTSDQEETATQGFRWRWRSARLARLLALAAAPAATRVRAKAADAARAMERHIHPLGAQLVGTWRADGMVVRIGNDGFVQVLADRFRWKTHRDTLVITPIAANAGLTMRFHFTVTGDSLRLTGGAAPDGRLLLKRTNSVSDKKAAQSSGDAWKALNAGDLPGAEADFRPLLAEGDRDRRVSIHAALAVAWGQHGRRDSALSHLAQLRSEVERSGYAESAGQMYVGTAEQLGEGAEALSVAKDMNRRYPANGELLKTIAWQSFLHHDTATAASAIDSAIVHSRDPQARSYFLTIRGMIVKTRNPELAIESAIESYLLSDDRTRLQQFFQLQPVRPADLTRAFDTLSVPAARRQAIIQVLAGERGDKGKSEALAIYEANLRSIVAAVKGAGARPVLLAYPFPSDVNSSVERVARATGAAWIDVDATFKERLKTMRYDDLFVADGHLNDAGYAIVAGLVLAHILQTSGSR